MADASRHPADGACAPAGRDGPQGARGTAGCGARRPDEPRTALSRILARQIGAARERVGIERVAIFALDGNRGRLFPAVSSVPSDPFPSGSSADTSPAIPLGLPPSGPLAECALQAEEIAVPATDDVASPDEAPFLRALGPSAGLVPLIGRQGLDCWREFGCSRRGCLAYERSEGRCWLVSGDVCRTKVRFRTRQADRTVPGGGGNRGPQDKLGLCLACPAFSVVGVLAIGGPNAAAVSELMAAPELRRLIADVTATVEASGSTRALLRLNAQLEDRVAEAAGERESAQQAALRSENLAATGKLVAGLAHQVNNPLAVISTCVQSLRMGGTPRPGGTPPRGGSDAAATERSLEIIATEVQRLSRLIRGLLDFACDRGLRVTEVDLRELVEQSVHLASPHARRSGVTVRLAEAEGCKAAVDRALMQQVLVNLIVNAVQASPRGGRVEVDFRLCPSAGGGTFDKLSAAVQSPSKGAGVGPTAETVEIVVRDNGPGIEPEALAKIFDPFFTTRSRSGGTGLGLSLSLSIVEQHGGTILVDSVPGEGAVFTVRLPVSQEDV